MTAIAKAAIGDILSATFLLLCTTLTFSVLRGATVANQLSSVFVFLLFFGAVFSKANNLVVLLLPLVLWFMHRRRRPDWPALSRGMTVGSGFAVLLFSAFVGHQLSNSGTPVDRLHLDELNFEPANTGSFATRVAKTAQMLRADYGAYRADIPVRGIPRASSLAPHHPGPGSIWYLGILRRLRYPESGAIVASRRDGAGRRICRAL